jgi:phenylpropionate dioxygenase-like ring-hydroxylating dioxygenase large terminal subunit
MTKPGEKFHTQITTPAPDMGTGPLPVEPYISAEFFEKEREKIFRRAWLEVARVEELPNPGDYLVREIEVLKTSVLLVRGKDGQVRGFHNVCTHRGMAVATCNKGNAQGFICTFHGWTFDIDGRLKGVPGEEYFADFKRDDYGLRPLATDVWNGFIFVHWEPQPKVGLREFLGGMATQLDDYPFARFNHIARYSARVKANWKTFIDAFHEAYHVMMVHRHTIPDACAGQENPYGLLSTARIYGPHHSGSVWVNPGHQPTPSETLAWKYGMSFAPGDMVDLPGLNPDKSANWWFDINVFFPNFFIDVGPGWYFTYNFWPVSVDESTWEMNIYQLEAETAGQKFAQEHTKVLLRDILYEDLSTLEFAQKAMASGVLKHLPISEMEIAVRHQLHTVQEWVNRP